MANSNPTDNTEYLTKRILKRATSKAFKEASENAMAVAGYVVVVKDGWVIRQHANGRVEKIEQVEKSENQTLALD